MFGRIAGEPLYRREAAVTSHDIAKALEIWTLQNVYNVSLFLGLLALGLSLIQRYYASVGEFLSLRVSIELWRVATTLIVDVLLVAVVVVGVLVLNPDIMADIKIAIPFGPMASVLFAAALVLRLFYGGHVVASNAFVRSMWLMAAANIIALTGFTFVMEAPSAAYLADHPSAFWTFLKTSLRSNANLELTQITFLVFFPLLIAVFVWGFRAALRQLAGERRG